MRLSIACALVLVAGGVIASCVDLRAHAQSGQRGDGHAEHHDWYRSLQTPHGTSCCNAQEDGQGDCRPVQARPSADGGWEAFVGGRWLSVPAERILPDHLNRVPLQSHICEQDNYVRCFLRGGSGT